MSEVLNACFAFSGGRAYLMLMIYKCLNRADWWREKKRGEGEKGGDKREGKNNTQKNKVGLITLCVRLYGGMWDVGMWEWIWLEIIRMSIMEHTWGDQY